MGDVEMVTAILLNWPHEMLAKRALRRSTLRICRRHPALPASSNGSQEQQLLWISKRCFSSGVDAFMEFEREMAMKRRQSQVGLRMSDACESVGVKGCAFAITSMALLM